MCGRYTITVQPELLAERFDAALPPEMSEPRYNAAPTQTLPVLLNEDVHNVQMLRWGLVPHWSKTANADYHMINARAETLEEKSTFREALRKRRCLVLADGFYEWKKTDDGKVPMRITLKSGEPFAFAGLWETWKDRESGELLRTFTIITTTPNDLMVPIHDRMPAMLLPEVEKAWLDDAAGPEAWRELLRPYPADLMKAYPVSKLVNSPSNESAALIAPAYQD